MGGPSINRAESSGDIWTPREFTNAVERTFDQVLTVDLAASGKKSTKALHWITPEQDSFKQDWEDLYYRYRFAVRGALWLNPPYSNITPWAKKCAETWEHNEQIEIFLLVPASIGANWFWDYVWNHSTVYSVGRMVFDNCFDRKTGQLVSTAYPKDLILCHYTNTTPCQTLQRWQWRVSEVADSSAHTTGGVRKCAVRMNL